MRKRRLLNGGSQEGSAGVEFVFGSLFVSFLLLAVIEVAFSLYGRNVVAASAHEAARAAIELGGGKADAEAVAAATVARSAGTLVDGYDVSVASTRSQERVRVTVRVVGELDPPGPLPVIVPVDLTATSVREIRP